MLQKNRKITKAKNKHLLRERWEYRLGTFSDKCHGGGKTMLTSARPHFHPIRFLQDEECK